MGPKLDTNMSKIKVIKNEQDYNEALKLTEGLIERDPEPNSEEGDQLSVLTALIQAYEAKEFPQTFPNPIDAIKFRMEQSDLTPSDLIPHLGSRSRVSEILSGKRSLTLEMVRALEAGLGIPAKVLIQKSATNESSDYETWDSRLITEMENRGYFGGKTLKKNNKSDLLSTFFSNIGNTPQLVGMLRQSTSYRSSPLTDKQALTAWATYIINQAKKIKATKKYKDGIVNLEFMQEFAKLSAKENGPILAQEYLRDHGIILIIEPHFPKTYLDGAAILINKDNPVIGLTLRYDRLDNFWFTLMHELAHIALHYNLGISLFYDEIEGIKTIELDQKEKEADKLAEEALLPNSKWEVSPAKLIPSSMAANSLARELGVHPAIIAGQIRHKGKKYIYLNKMVNEERVRKYFPDITWK